MFERENHQRTNVKMIIVAILASRRFEECQLLRPSRKQLNCRHLLRRLEECRLLRPNCQQQLSFQLLLSTAETKTYPKPPAKKNMAAVAVR